MGFNFLEIELAVRANNHRSGAKVLKKSRPAIKKLKMYLTKKKLGQEGPRPSLGCVLSHIHVDLHLTLYKIMAKYVAKFVEIDFSIFCCKLRKDWPWTLSRYSWPKNSTSIISKKFIIFATTLNMINCD